MHSLTKEQVLATEEALLAAMKSHDIARLDELLHDDLLFHTPDGQIFTKAMDLAMHKSGEMVINRIEASDHVISIMGDTAVVSLKVEASGMLGEHPMEGAFRYLRVWKLFDGKLKVIGGSCIQEPATPAP